MKMKKISEENAEDFWRSFLGNDVSLPPPVSISVFLVGFPPSSVLLTPDSASQWQWQPGAKASVIICPTDWRSYEISKGLKAGHGNIAELFHIIQASGFDLNAFTLKCDLALKIYED